VIADPTSPAEADPTAEVPADGSNRLKWVVVVALLARLFAIAVWPENLTDDRDGYLALAEGLTAGRGYSVPGSDQPTAYRPPLYPLLLMPAAILPSAVWVGLLHLGLGAAAVWLTWRLAVRLTQSCPAALCAAALVALDPLLLRYATFPMTETLAACLVAGLLVVLADETGRLGTWSPPGRSLLTGVLFGLAALCRPTVWAFAMLAGFWRLTRWIRRHISRRSDTPSGSTSHAAHLHQWLVVAAAAIVLLPWGVRNWLQFGRPILMTTHGGYTLLLGNNPQFAREVVDQSWGTVWDGTHGDGQAAWAASINQQMDQAGLTGELARDRWMRDRAIEYIAADPSTFVRACWLRVRRFWGLMPIEGASNESLWIRRGIGAFYAFVFVGAIAGVLHIARHWSPRWIPSLLMIAGFLGVHLVYWTNIRMRAPIVPILAVLAALGWCRLRIRALRRSPGE
jgi:hypothetical protein